MYPQKATAKGSQVTWLSCSNHPCHGELTALCCPAKPALVLTAQSTSAQRRSTVRNLCTWSRADPVDLHDAWAHEQHGEAWLEYSHNI